MRYYEHKEYKTQVKATSFKKGMEDGYINEKFLFFFTRKRYYVTITSPHLDNIIVTNNDMIVKFGDRQRIYKAVYPRKNFLKKFKLLERNDKLNF